MPHFVIVDLNTRLFYRATASSQHESGDWTDDREEAMTFTSKGAAEAQAKRARTANPERLPSVFLELWRSCECYL